MDCGGQGGKNDTPRNIGCGAVEDQGEVEETLLLFGPVGVCFGRGGLRFTFGLGSPLAFDGAASELVPALVALATEAGAAAGGASGL